MRLSVAMVLLVLAHCCAVPVSAETQVGPTAEEIYQKAETTGGLVVHLGCDDPPFLASLRPDDRYLVQGFDRDPGLVDSARTRLRELGVLGWVSVAVLDAERLPFRDDFANLVIAPRRLGLKLDELMRVLRPNGVLYVKEGTDWRLVRKGESQDTDDWTHFLYDSTNNAVSRDKRVGPINAIQWVDLPLWTRSHDYLCSFTAAVSDNGRLFYVADEAPVASVTLPPSWYLTCRDAYNGIVQWKRKLAGWFDHLQPMRSGPNQLMRRLVAADGKVFATLDLHSAVSVLDPVTGRTTMTFAGTENTEEILYRDGCLYALVNPGLDSAFDEHYNDRLVRRGRAVVEIPRSHKVIVAVDVGSGDEVWRKFDDDTQGIMALTLAADQQQLYYATDKAVVCLDRAGGGTLWRTEHPVELRRPGWSDPTLAVHKDVVLFGDRTPVDWEDADLRLMANGGVGGAVTALSAENGKRLWACGTQDGFHFPVEVFAIRDCVWTGKTAYPDREGFVRARDYLTGEIAFERKPDSEYRKYVVGHHRCHRNKATDRFIITGRAFLEWIDTRTGVLTPSIFLRGTCAFGVLPANGLTYVPPNACMCAWNRKINGFCGMLEASSASPPRRPERIEGPMYGAAFTDDSPEHDSWPTYRHDSRRSGASGMTLRLPVEAKWRRNVGGRLSGMTAARGKLFVSSIDARTLSCLDAHTGDIRWQFSGEGRLDSPPTLWKGRAIFADTDGYLYALDIESGMLVWKMDLARQRQLIYSFGQLESCWPGHGSVLVKDGHVYTVVGRSPFLDGGMRLCRISAARGELVSERHLVGEVGKTKQSGEFLPDILSGADDGFYMRHAKFDYETLADRPTDSHLWSPTGFLDFSWFHRTYWLFGDWYGRTWPLNEREMPVAAGRLLSIDHDAGLAFGFGRSRYGWGIQPDAWRSGQKQYQIRATPISVRAAGLAAEPDTRGIRRGIALARRSLWAVEATVEARAMAVTPEHVILAGPRADTVFSLEAFEGKKGIALQVLDRGSGELLQEKELDAMPVYDGLAMAFGRAYLALQDGSVVCFEGGPR